MKPVDSGRPDIGDESLVYEFDLEAPVEKVWHALTDPELVAQWMLPAANEPDADIDLQLAACQPPHYVAHDTMQWVKCPIWTLCMGTSYSMGSFLLMAGTAGHRIALPNASIMLHQPSGGFQGKASDIERHAADIMRTKRRLTALYAQHCGHTLEDVAATLERDCFMSAEEARAWGVVDHVFKTRAAA
jgi:ATP-dependent Clp protease protease subunit